MKHMQLLKPIKGIKNIVFDNYIMFTASQP